MQNNVPIINILELDSSAVKVVKFQLLNALLRRKSKDIYLIAMVNYHDANKTSLRSVSI